MDIVLQIKGLSKSHFKKAILKDINLELKSGKIMGIFGPNSSGKSTLLKTIIGITGYEKGEILVNGGKTSKNIKELIAYVPENISFEKWMTPKDYLEFYKELYKDFDMDKAEKILQEYGINLKEKMSSLSKGKQEIFAIVSAFSRNARLFLLDEPLAAIDIIAREKIIKMILEKVDEECSIIMVTHLIRDVAKIFDTVVFMDKGMVNKICDVEELQMDTGKSIEDNFKEMFRNVYAI